MNMEDYKLLNTIKTPADVRRLSFAQLGSLAEEVRRRIIEVTARNGGHVAPSLGATDIAIALLKVFDPYNDRIVWDVGHQSYAYKILTGRNDRFDTLRQFEGISGFNNIFESEADAFGVGHSSTSISAALGIKVADDLLKRDNQVVAVIGDGALTGGMALEAINHAGHLNKNLIVVLNDNAYSISKNVGALQNYMAGMLVSKSYNTLKEKVWDLSKTLPTSARRTFVTGAQKIEESLINILVPNIIFEDLGFKYVGPIDGHDIARMVRIFHKVQRNVVGPVLIHVVTQKGKGYGIAENDARRFHGVGPYDQKTGQCLKKKGPASYSQVFGDTLCRLAEQSNRVVAVTAAMTDGTGLAQFAQRFPSRFFDVGIAEQHAVTFAAGQATRGIKPFVAIYSTFMQRAIDQVIHDIALQRLPVVLCLDRGGLVGDDGATHHGAFDLSYLRFIPRLTIAAPRCAEELEALLVWANAYNDGPVAIRYPRGQAHCCNSIAPIEHGKSEVVLPGRDIAFIGVGKGYHDAEAVRDMLREADPSCEPYLINARFIKPLDTALLDELSTTCRHIVTIEDNALQGGYGEAVSAYLANTDTKVHTFGLPDEFVPHGSLEELHTLLKLRPQDIFATLRPTLLPGL